jgi:hypothetical protein
VKTEAFRQTLRAGEGVFHFLNNMDDLRKLNFEQLHKMKTELEKLVNNHGEININKILKVKEIFVDDDGDLATTYFFERVKLKDLVDKYTGEHVFKKEQQTEEYIMSNKHLGFVKAIYAEFTKLQFRLNQILNEIYRIKYGEYSELPLTKIRMRDYYMLNSQDLIELFILTTHIEMSNDNNFTSCRKMYRMNRKSYTLTEDKTFDDMFYDLSDIKKNEITSTISKNPKPSPEKTYKKVFVGCIPEAEKNSEIREIRFQLINNPNKNIITAEQKDYYIYVKKHIEDDADFADYYLYNADDYFQYLERIKEPLLEICKRWNEEEYSRLVARIDEINEYDKSESAKNISRYLDEVKFRFEEWFRQNGLGIPYNRKGLLEIIQSRIRRRINEDVKLKRSFMTTSERESYIEELSTKIIKGMNDISASNILESIIYNKNYVLPSELELVKLIDEFLLGIDSINFPLPNPYQELNTESFVTKQKPIKEFVKDILSEKEAKKKVLKPLPKNEVKQNQKWELTNEQVYRKYFAGRKNEYPNSKDYKGTVIRAIKDFRNPR